MNDTALQDQATTAEPRPEETFPIIETPDGLPGFVTARHWAIERQESSSVFGLLRNLDQPGIGLLVAEPWDLAPGYEPDLPDEDLARIDVRDASDVYVQVVATIAAATEATPGTVFLNLAAPIVVNTRTHQARQVILDRQGWPLRHAIALKG